jgi:hypothetical protein
MHKVLLASIAVLVLATGSAHAGCSFFQPPSSLVFRRIRAIPGPSI